MRLEAGSMLLVFVALAPAENDDATARQLFLTTKYRRTIDFMAYSIDFAKTLGVTSEYHAIARSRTPEETSAHQRTCIEAVQAEITRRGWNTQERPLET
ncbi:MAG: hypothetical protein KC481_10650 [Acidimicrobiaceae bacterium]|nr:hypothetical protein [Acidimicrobiaceae bacterium]MCH9804535.1 hypothetical protein [bacterium]MCO4834108.1 hypothetical protein [Acidimicrobiaceae bacterium]HAY68827.1 hypothetical protein [Acidimicrobiaceae bacterium]